MLEEKIIFAPSVNESNLLKTLAANDINTFGVRVLNTYSLLEYFLSKKGIVDANEIMDKITQECVIYSLMLANPNDFKMPSFEEASKLVETINELRRECVKISKLENKTLVKAYSLYTDYKKEHNMVDSIDYIENSINYLDSKYSDSITVLTDFTLSKLDELILSRFNTTYLSLKQTFNLEDKKPNIIKYFSGYGKSNEIEGILDYIHTNNICLDECSFVLTSDDYVDTVVTTLLKYDIPFNNTFRSLITRSNAFALFEKLIMNDLNYNSVEELDSLLNAPYFNKKLFLGELSIDEKSISRRIDYQRFVQNLGHLRLARNNKVDLDRIKTLFKDQREILKYHETNPCEDVTKEISEFLEFENAIYAYNNFINEDYSSLINKYTIIDSDYQLMCKQQLILFLNSYKETIGKIDMETLMVLRSLALDTSHNKDGLLITSLNDYSRLRKNVFIVGLNNTFPGNKKENYLIYDDEISSIDKDSRLLSENKIIQKKDNFYNYIELLGSLDSNIYLSFSSYDLCSNREQNPTSLLYATCKKYINSELSLKDFKNQYKILDYKTRLSNDHVLIDKTMNNEHLAFVPSFNEVNHPVSLDTEFSPSSIMTYFQCPRKFYYKNILYLDEDMEYNLSQSFPASDYGTLIHSIIQALYELRFSDYDEFMDYAGLRIRAELDKFYYFDNLQYLNDCKELLDIASQQYNLLHEKVISLKTFDSMTEEYIEAIHQPTGVRLKGYADRISIENGRAIIVDYKAKNKFEHEKDDIDSCIQTIIYAYMLEHSPKYNGKYKVDHTEYHYIKKNKIITCVYNQEMEDKLNEKLTIFRDALVSGEFPKEPKDKDGKIEFEEDNCKRIYCKYYGICKKH